MKKDFYQRKLRDPSSAKESSTDKSVHQIREVVQLVEVADGIDPVVDAEAAQKIPKRVRSETGVVACSPPAYPPWSQA